MTFSHLPLRVRAVVVPFVNACLFCKFIVFYCVATKYEKVESMHVPLMFIY